MAENGSKLELQRIFLSPAIFAQSPIYSPLILPSALSRLLSSSSDFYWVAVEARLEGQIVGLALAEIYLPTKIAKLFSLVIQENHRRRGIGRQLFAFMQHLLTQQEGVRGLSLEYAQGDPYAPALDRMIESQGWLPAKIYLVRCFFDVSTFNPSWLYYPFRLPHSMTFFQWKDLLPADKERIHLMTQQGRFLPHLSPLSQAAEIDWPTSIGLRHKGQIVGWCITHRLDPITVGYSILYVDSDLHATGYSIQLLAESIRHLKQLSIPQALFEVNLEEISPSWWRFVRKRLIPLASKVEYIKRAALVFV